MNDLLPASLDELPVTRVRDLLMSTLGDSTLTNGIFSDILGRLSNLSNMKGNNSPTASDTEWDRTPSNQVEKFKDDNSILDASDMRSEEYKNNVRQSSRVMYDFSPSRGVLTRSMTRSKSLKNQLEGNLSSSSTYKRQKTREDSGSDLVKSYQT